MSTVPEQFMVPIYYSLGTVSLAVNGFSVYLIKKKSSFFTPEIRQLFMNVQISCLIQNFIFTFLYQPILRPFYGGGYCEGLLCRLGVKFYWNFLIVMTSVVTVLGSFLILLFNREQALLPAGSTWRVGIWTKRVIFFSCYACLIALPISFIFYETSPRDQYSLLSKENVDNMRWVKENKNWAVNEWVREIPVYWAVMYIAYYDMLILGAVAALCIVHILILARRSTTLSTKGKMRYTAKAKNAFTILLQFVLYLVLVGLPILVSFVFCSKEDSQWCPIGPEISFSCFSIVNSIVFIIGNKQYKKILVKKFFNIAVVNVMNSVTESANVESTI